MAVTGQATRSPPSRACGRVTGVCRLLTGVIKGGRIGRLPRPQGQPQGQPHSRGGGQAHGEPRPVNLGAALDDRWIAVPVVVKVAEPRAVLAGGIAHVFNGVFGERPRLHDDGTWLGDLYDY